MKVTELFSRLAQNRLRKPVVGRRRRLVVALALAAVCQLLVLRVEAHDPGLSAADLRIGKSGISATITLAQGDVETLVPVDADRDGEITSGEMNAARSSLETLASSSLEVRISE